jgi:hypothetical protein
VSAAALAERPGLLPASSAATGLDSRSGGGRLTLEQVLDGVWEGLQATGAAECPLCRARMSRSGAAEGRCGGCGSTLA